MGRTWLLNPTVAHSTCCVALGGPLPSLRATLPRQGCVRGLHELQTSSSSPQSLRAAVGRVGVGERRRGWGWGTLMLCFGFLLEKTQLMLCHLLPPPALKINSNASARAQAYRRCLANRSWAPECDSQL